ncbi:MAG: nucleotidyl transferase AbiEii/AbiGii toxin family protein [Gammaproteobacteria bacterium]
MTAPLDHALHKNLLLQILKDIYSDTSISSFLGFKGGTAAFIFYGLERFSTDLDFDLLETAKEDQVFAKVQEILHNYGEIKEARKKRFSLFFLLSYRDKAHNIKVEINRRVFGSHYEVKTYLGISMLVMVREDMFAHKLVAMYERLGKSNRDIFDVWFFLQNNWPINKEIVQKRTDMPWKKFLKTCISSLEKMNDKHILNGIGEFLSNKQKDWVKTKLRTETLFLLKLRLDNDK